MHNVTIENLQKEYQSGRLTPADLVKSILSRCNEEDKEIWIYRLSEEELSPYIERLGEEYRDDLPLYGIPFAIKDNIDLAGVPTTAGCPEYSYTPEESAFVVQQLVDAGAIPIGKTNLDQFATGLVGTRSPYGGCRNSFDPEYISGGSSSGSAVAVAKGLCSFSLGTDTAGSGRVPAALNNLIGIKPTKGLLSTRGVVPACRSLDCVSIFALCAADARTIMDVAAQYDREDPFSRRQETDMARRRFQPEMSFTYGVPRAEQLQFFGNREYEEAFAKSIAILDSLGGDKVEIDFEPFLSAARLLYDGPWVLERTAAIGPFLESHPEAGDPVVRNIICSSPSHSAVELFQAMYQLQGLKRKTDDILATLDLVITPTAGTAYTHNEVAANPVQFNSHLGYYTNFMNLLDYCAVAVPTCFTSKLPFGITLFGQSFLDSFLSGLAGAIHQKSGLPMGTGEYKPGYLEQESGNEKSHDEIVLAVCGAHLKGFPLHHQLVDGNARFIKTTKTSSSYTMFALKSSPPKPGLIRNSEHGGPIEVELYGLSAEAFGAFTANIPHPLGIGKLELEDGSWVPGFIAEPVVAEEGEDITHFGGWRGYLASTYSFYVTG